ncbi:kinase, putative [Syntrophotalea carbinolica DSM 2380]|uniref:Kinase, putative n=1 Tax=Syntrophotalea carbinolica (strain DSM 2380 / NBRC 103641 / GraBd1) TaxID=338963 RepID=Q3A539_SYNC1|nr:kinase [Syntrophotalea carbinolica]ABA88518.1 kinase, putative [Syntrophotalea carbinolica DSM 2380]
MGIQPTRRETPAGVEFERRGVYRCYFARGTFLGEIKEALLPDPERLFRLGEKVSSGRSGNPRDQVKVVVGSKPYFVKRYNCQGTYYRIKNIFRASRALRSIRAGQLLLSIGIPTPAPLVGLEERHLGLLGRSYLVCPFLEGCRSLRDLWPELDDSRRQYFLRVLGGMMGRMHRAHVIHGDSNWRNILIGNEHTSHPQIWLVDLDGVRRYRRLPAERAERDIGHFLRDLSRIGADRETVQLFRRHWQHALNNL